MSDENIEMSPDHSPVRSNSVRSANNVPIYLGATVLLIVVAIVSMVASDRAKTVAIQSGNSGEPIHVTDTKHMARNIVGGSGLSGYVPPAKSEPPVQAVIPPSPDLGPAIEIAEAPVELRQDEEGNLYSANSTLNAPPVPPNQTQNNQLQPNIREPIDEEAMRIQAAKLQALEAAVRAGTTVEISSKRNSSAAPISSYSAPQNSYTSRQNTLNEISKLQQGGQDDTSNALASLTEQINNATQGRFPATDTNRADREKKQNEILATSGDVSRNRWQLGTLIEAPETDYVIRTGFVIPATMISGINSDLPGQVIAQVSQNVSDTSTGSNVLIPQGSKLIGSYVSNIAFAQRRVMVAWQRIVFPDGKALDIGSMPGSDMQGYSGLSDKVNNHYVRIFGSALLMSGITASVSLSQGDFDDDDDSRSAREELSAAVGQQLGQVALEMIRKNLDISPTLEIRPGFRFNVMVTKDITFNGPYKSFDY